LAAYGWMAERRGSTETQDVYGTRIRLSRDGLRYGEEFVPFEEMGGGQAEPQVIYNPGTKLSEVVVYRSDGPDLVVKNLPLGVAEQLRAAIIAVLRERHA
jgi:hypothetical protein